jgi:UDP-glucose 4-epimerase
MIGGGDSLRCNLGTGVGISVKQIINIAEQVTGQKVPVKYGDRRPGDPAHLVADPGHAKKLLGWEASRKDPRSMIETSWKWMSQRHNGRFTS